MPNADAVSNVFFNREFYTAVSKQSADALHPEEETEPGETDGHAA
jgi:hypothetical protein